ncbi:hypothetical protein OG735_41065 (plasmid) [Streptomyces sp. NBC_01210]|uniref:hypothetical protein n=1 Tax=Streptomyces sp. NBC_01210 TaxID=2903774 RepID=UPI002E1126D5|nr:hypothetical protein OG735_41065 [Streptomyces sp. NBC_01210]
MPGVLPGVEPGVEPGFLEGRRDSAGVHALRPAPGGHILVIFGLAFAVRNQGGPPPERFCGGP